MDIQIRETVTASAAVLYAYLDGEQVAALDFTRKDGDIHVNMLFVKPQFRRRGIASALARHLASQYPGARISCRERR